MKLLKIGIENSSLFSNEFEMSLINKSRIIEEDVNTSVDVIKQSIGTLNINAVAGVNASGKTSTLRLVEFILDVFGNCEDIDTDKSKQFIDDIYIDKPITFISYWYFDNKIVLVKSTVGMNDQGQYIFTKEEVFEQKVISSTSKQNIFDFKNVSSLLTRETISEEVKRFIKDSTSIFIGIKEGLVFTSSNIMNIDVNYTIIQSDQELTRLTIDLLDPNVEYIKKSENNDELYAFKFKNRDEINIDNTRINEILSSGTIKSTDILFKMNYVFKFGGYMIIDEIENHLHLSIVKKILRMFEDRHINKKNATLIFTTHYSEILDVVDRNDSINIVSNSEGNIICKNLTDYQFRNKNDFVRKNLFESGKINTTPSYEKMRKLERYYEGIHKND